MYCRECGAENPIGATVCQSCGAPIHRALSATPIPKAPVVVEPIPDPEPTEPEIEPIAEPEVDDGRLFANQRLSADEVDRINAGERVSFRKAALIAAVLYLFLWVPGFVASIIFMRRARRVEKIIGHTARGATLLRCVFFGLGVFPLVAFFMLTGLAIAIG